MVLAAAQGRREMLEFLLDHYQNLCTPQDSSKVRELKANCSYWCADSLLV